MSRKKKILIIGIDGGTFDIIRPLVQQGDLPNIAALMKAGVSSELVSTVPPVTAPAWVSFMTGKNPGKHSIFHFFGHTHDTYPCKPLSAADIKTETLWSILSECGKQLILLNVPITYPPTKINGIMIPGIGTPPGSQNFTYPPDIYQELLREIGDYQVDYWDDVLDGKDISPARLSNLIENLNHMTEKRTDAVLYLTKKYNWDLCMVVYVLTDRLQHLFWRFMDTSHPNHDPELAKLFGQTILDGYRKVDEAIGKILREIDDDATVIVMSDHGFGPLHKSFFINQWLIREGLLKLKTALPWRFQTTNPSIQRILTKLRLGPLTGIIPSKLLRLTVPKIGIVRKRWDEIVDWSKTKAYASDPIGIRVNLKGRESEGIVNPGEEYETLISNLEEKLYQICDPVTGEKIVDNVARKEHIYSGAYVNEAKDLLFVMKGLAYLPHPAISKSKELFGKPENMWSGTHRFNGILIMKGPEIKPLASSLDTRITDIAPTILHLFNKSVPKDMDGSVIEKAFYPDYMEANPVTYDERDRQEHISEKALSEGDEEKVRKHLESLGYL